MKKRALCLFTALCLTASLAAPALAADADTKLETIRVLGILSGDGNGNLDLGNAVTRAEFVTMMTAASPYKDTVGASNGSALFKDVKTGHWASGYIRLAVEQGWVSGYVDGTFRPGNTITLEEACTALLRMLGYDSGALAGSFPSAQLSKASAIGLLDDLDVKQCQKLTRQECVGLFYNALLAETSGGQVYGTTLGYTITNDELDWPTLVNKNTKGPYMAQSGAVSLPFSTSGVTVYRNGTASSLSAVKQYDVYYYNESLRTVWVYSDRITGTLTDVSPNTAAPTAVTVAGTDRDRIWKDQELIDDIAAGYRKVIQALYDAGCRNIQLDDCSWGVCVDPNALGFFGTDAAGLAEVEEQLLAVNNLALRDKPADLTITTHICRGNFHSTWACQGGYDAVAELVFGREDVDAYYLEFDDERSGSFAPLKAVSGDKKVVLGLITTKSPVLEQKDAVIARIHEAAQYLPLDRLCLSPQCGFASCEVGNKLTEEEQWAKLTLVKEIAEEVWG